MRKIKISTLLIAGLLFVASHTRAPADVSFDFFYSNLNPHGSWQVSASYGNVWQPDVYSSGWHPYYDGHWDYTDVGWCWVSDYEWGAIPYHYGTWVYDDFYGWVWVPGYVWAPAWVVYRTGPDYIGWAPVLPSFSVGISVGAPAFDRRHFVFVPTQYFARERVRRYAVPSSRTTVIINKTTIVNNITIANNVVVNRGPDLRLIERASGKRISPLPVERVRRAIPERLGRQEIRIDSQRLRGGVRAAEPNKSKALPMSRGQAPDVDRERGRRGTVDMREEADRPAPEGSLERRRGPEERREPARPGASEQPREQQRGRGQKADDETVRPQPPPRSTVQPSPPEKSRPGAKDRPRKKPPAKGKADQGKDEKDKKKP